MHECGLDNLNKCKNTIASTHESSLKLSFEINVGSEFCHCSEGKLLRKNAGQFFVFFEQFCVLVSKVSELDLLLWVGA